MKTASRSGEDRVTSSTSVAIAKPARVESLDIYRGFVMLLMMAEVLHLGEVAKAYPESPLLSFLAWHQHHIAWRGCTLHDLIQPSFTFLVGAALPFSLAARRARGQSTGTMTAHALWRAFLLVALGIFLRSTAKPMTNFTFEDTLTQIGLGYPFLFLLGLRPPKVAWWALAAILLGVWGAWAFYPVAEPWAKNANLGSDFDRWFLNLFPRPRAVRGEPGRLPHALLHPHARHRDSRPDCRPLARGGGPGASVSPRRCRSAGRRARP